MKVKLVCLIFCFSIQAFSFAQKPEIDSLQQLVKKDKQDTSLANHLRYLCFEYQFLGKFDTAVKYAEASLSLCKKLNFTSGTAKMYITLGETYKNMANYSVAKKYYFDALPLFKQLNDLSDIAFTLNGISVIYKEEGDYLKAVDYCLKGLAIGEKSCDKEDLCFQLHTMAGIYYKLKNYHKVVEYCNRSLKIGEELKDLITISTSLGGLAVAYAGLKNNEKAFELYERSLKMFRAQGNEQGVAGVLNNMGVITKDHNKAIALFLESLKIREKHKNKNAMINLYSNLSDSYTEQKKYALAETMLFKALAMQKEIGSMEYLPDVLRHFAALYLAKKDYKKAYDYYNKYRAIKDSLYNIEKEKDITRKEMNFEFDKKEAASKAEHDKQLALAEEDKKRERLFSWFIAAIALSIAIIALVVFRSLRITRNQKQKIEEQSQLLQEHQTEIIDSITYAKRIQDAILPPVESIQRKLPSSFVLYKPKDIVAGDFYWMEEFDGIIFIAAADCTGHGVPGAMVSMVCSNALTRAVKEFGLRDTGKILDIASELLLETFEKSSEEVKDGMDVSLLAVDKKSKKISWSGANNPLWYIYENKLEEIKADKQPIGKTEFPRPFTTHLIEFKESTSYFLFTDGLADQFGGPLGKKYKYKQLSNLLTSITHLDQNEQVKIIENSFKEWKGNLEQVDDVCVIGVRI